MAATLKYMVERGFWPLLLFEDEKLLTWECLLQYMGHWPLQVYTHPSVVVIVSNKGSHYDSRTGNQGLTHQDNGKVGEFNLTAW